MQGTFCFICHQTYFESTKHQEEQVHFFKTPTHKLSLWKEKLNDDLLETSHICSRHFEAKYINTFMRVGKEYCRLSRDAEPTLLLNASYKNNASATECTDEQKPSTSRKSRARTRTQLPGKFLQTIYLHQ